MCIRDSVILAKINHFVNTCGLTGDEVEVVVAINVVEAVQNVALNRGTLSGGKLIRTRSTGGLVEFVDPVCHAIGCAVVAVVKVRSKIYPYILASRRHCARNVRRGRYWGPSDRLLLSGAKRTRATLPC